MKTTHSHNKADYIGILGSVLCIIHCILLPAVTFGSAVGHAHVHNSSLLSLDLLFIIINGIAVYFATKTHASSGLKLLLWSGLLIFGVSILLESHSSAFIWLGYIGSGMLILGHFYNLFVCQIAPRFKLKI
jgi:hypothetical protein